MPVRCRSDLSASDVDLSYKDKIDNLSCAKEPVEVAIGGEWSDMCGVIPNVSVAGFGVLGLPLSGREADHLAKVRFRPVLLIAS